MKRALRAADDGGPLWAAALCAAIVLAVSGLWGCYLLAHLGTPGLAGSAQDLTNLLYALPAAAAGVVLHAHRPGIPAGWSCWSTRCPSSCRWPSRPPCG